MFWCNYHFLQWNTFQSEIVAHIGTWTYTEGMCFMDYVTAAYPV